MKDAMGHDPQSKANHDAYLRRKANGYYANKLASKTQAERDAEAEAKRAMRHADGATPRSTNAELRERRQALLNIVREQQPATVRAIFYQAVIAGLVGKGDYKSVQRDLAVMRQDKADTPLANSLPYEWIVDTSRRVHHPASFESVSDALDWLARVYRKDLWTDADCVVQVWLEKDALTGVLSPVTHKYDVPLLVARGFSSLSFIYEAAKALEGETRPVYVYHFGDHDYYGRKASASIDATLKDLAPGADIHFKSLAVTLDQIRKWKLPTRPSDLEGVKADEWDNKPTVELDAIAPNRLRELLERHLSGHLSPKMLARLKRKEGTERDYIRSLG